tara:strand:+ start:1526 stop:1675 length:150 start_codon:yes stop_codon:yes gene_type:complete
LIFRKWNPKTKRKNLSGFSKKELPDVKNYYNNWYQKVSCKLDLRKTDGS